MARALKYYNINASYHGHLLPSALSHDCALGSRDGYRVRVYTVNPERIASVIFNDFINPATLTSLYDNDFSRVLHAHAHNVAH